MIQELDMKRIQTTQQNIIPLKGGPLDKKRIIKIIRELSNQPSHIHQHQISLEGERENRVNNIMLKKQISQTKKSQSKPIQRWQRQKFLKYICFSDYHKDLYDRKKRAFIRECRQYLQIPTQSFTIKHHDYFSRYGSIENICNHFKSAYNFTSIEINKQQQKLDAFIQKKKIQRKQLLQQPSKFLKFMQALKLQPHHQICEISFNHFKIKSKPLSYQILNLDDFDQKQLKDKQQTSKTLYVLFNAQFQLNNTELENLKNQIIEQNPHLQEEKDFNVEAIEKIPQYNLKNENVILLETNEKKDVQNPKDCKSYINENNFIHQIHQKQQYPKSQPQQLAHLESDQSLSESIPEQDQQDTIKYDISKNFGKEQKQLLNLELMLGLSTKQVQYLEVLIESKLTEIKIMNVSNFEGKYKNPSKFDTGRGTWTEDEILRLTAFLVLHHKFFSLNQICATYELQWMVEFVKIRNPQSIRKKAKQFKQKSSSLEQIIQKNFVRYKLLREQFQQDLKRQAAIYFESPKTIALEKQTKSTRSVDMNLSKMELKKIIEQKLLSGPIEISNVTIDSEEKNLLSIITRHLSQFKEEFEIKNMKQPYVKIFFKQLQQKDICSMDFQKFRLLYKKIEGTNSVNLSKGKIGKNEQKVKQFFQAFQQKSFTVMYLYKVVIQSKPQNNKNKKKLRKIF